MLILTKITMDRFKNSAYLTKDRSAHCILLQFPTLGAFMDTDILIILIKLLKPKALPTLAIMVWFFTLFSCANGSQKKSVLNHASKEKSPNTTYYIEFKNFESELLNCIRKELMYKKCSSDMQLYEVQSTKLQVPQGESIHIFLPYEIGHETWRAGSQKITITYNKTTLSEMASFSIERYVFEESTAWRKIINLGNFQIEKNNNTWQSIEDSEIVDLCLQIRNTVVLSSFK